VLPAASSLVRKFHNNKWLTFINLSLANLIIKIICDSAIFEDFAHILLFFVHYHISLKSVCDFRDYDGHDSYKYGKAVFTLRTTSYDSAGCLDARRRMTSYDIRRLNDTGQHTGWCRPMSYNVDDIVRQLPRRVGVERCRMTLYDIVRHWRRNWTKFNFCVSVVAMSYDIVQYVNTAVKSMCSITATPDDIVRCRTMSCAVWTPLNCKSDTYNVSLKTNSVKNTCIILVRQAWFAYHIKQKYVYSLQWQYKHNHLEYYLEHALTVKWILTKDKIWKIV